MKKLKILNAEAEDYSGEALQMLLEWGEVDEKNLTQRELWEGIENYEVVIIRLGLKIDKTILDRALKLRYIVSATTGTDHIDVAYATQKGIEIVCLQGETDFLQSIPSTAEHTWALLLAVLRNIPAAYRHVLEGKWERQLFRGHNLFGQKIGILGLGRVGKQVARFAIAFGCSTGAFDPHLSEWPIQEVSRFDDPESLLRWCDILCIHIPYNAGNHHFLNLKMLSNLQPGAVLINTSRSGIWDERAIVELLQSRHIAALATDVIDNEQTLELRADSLLLKYAQNHPHVLITPHIAGATFESMNMTEVFIAEKLTKIINSPCVA